MKIFPRVFFLFVVSYSTVVAADLDSRTHQALQEMRLAINDADLVEVGKRFADLRGSLVLWRDAVAIARSEIGDTPSGRAATARLLRLALIVDSEASTISKWSSNKESIDTLNQEDIKSLRKATFGFPNKNDAIIYLLNRNPSLRSQANPGEYTVIRISPDLTHSVVIEHSTYPFMDLGPVWKKSVYDIDSDPVQMAPEEHGQTRRFSLQGLPNVVLAAKAFHVAESAPPLRRGYAAYIASEALASGIRYLGMSAAQGDEAGYLVWAIRQWALEQLLASSNDTILGELAQEISLKLPTAAFSSRAFPEAADAYGKMFKAEPERRLWAAWGQGISYFAAGEYKNSAIAFKRITPLLLDSKNAMPYSYILLAFLHNLPESERAALGDLTGLIEAAEKILASKDVNPDQLVTMDLDYAKIMVTIGRTDLGLAHIARRLDSVELLADKNRSRIETRYLRELAAFSRDLCYDISWTLSSSSGWKVRTTEDYPPQLDFLHNLKDTGELVGPGEIITIKEGIPYGMLSPEEDCVTVFAVHGGGHELSEQPTTEPSISKWALNALNRRNPNPSLAPYLKVVWVEWFSQQFEPLKVAGISAQDFVYRPQNTSGIASLQEITALKSHPAISAHERDLVSTFLSLRALLERRYPNK